jgi:hypothetical protein
MEYSERLPALLNPAAEQACFYQVLDMSRQRKQRAGRDSVGFSES